VAAPRTRAVRPLKRTTKADATGLARRAALKSLFTVNEGPWRWRVGLEAALATALPLTVLTAIGLGQVGLMASLGSFTALYAAALKRSERLRAQVLVGLGLVAASSLGVVLAGSAWLTLIGVMLVASLASLLILGFSVGPPGPIMFILVNGVSAYLSAPAALGGQGVPGHVVVLLVAAGAASSLLVAGLPLLLPKVRRSEGEARPLSKVFGYLELERGRRWVAVRVVAAVLVASLVSVPLGVQRAYWVVLAAVAILQASHRVPLTVTRAVQRLLGTLGGVLLFLLAARLGPTGLWLVLLVSGLQFLTETVVAKNYGLALLFITPTALVISTAGLGGELGAVVGERVFDTFLGALVALAVLFVTVWASLKPWRSRAGRHRG